MNIDKALVAAFFSFSRISQFYGRFIKIIRIIFYKKAQLKSCASVYFYSSIL